MTQPKPPKPLGSRKGPTEFLADFVTHATRRGMSDNDLVVAAASFVQGWRAAGAATRLAFETLEHDEFAVCLDVFEVDCEELLVAFEAEAREALRRDRGE